jgi:protein-disulfide isomerase
MTRINANGFNIHLLRLFASIRVIRGEIFSLFVCIRPARRSLSEGGCSFVVGPGTDLTIPSLRRSFSLSLRSMKRYLPFVIVATVALVAVGSGAMLYRAKRPQLLSIPENKSPSGKSGTESMHVRGNPDAPVTLEEFADFQCPPCGSFAGFGEELLKQYDSRLRIVFRNFPLPGHEHAREAALAAEAAGLQGRFWEMHDVLYREQSVWSNAPNTRELFESYAGTIGLNLDQFRKDMDGEKAKEQVDSDHALGDSLGIKVTPTLFINNHPVEPKDKNPEGVRAAINAALEEKSKTGA